MPWGRGPLRIPAPVSTGAQGVADEIARRIGELGGNRVDVDAAEILTGRAALRNLSAPTQISAGGATRLLASPDGWWALTLSRADDVDAVPALLERDDVGADPWPSVVSASTTGSARAWVRRARLLGLPAAVLGESRPAEPTVGVGGAPAQRSLADLLVVDLSSMWAGPLCGALLAAAGATVVKVETPARPDGTRAGDPQFFAWMNAQKLSCCVALEDPILAGLLAVADVVVEGSRPGGLRRRGLGAEQVAARAGRVWVRISGYGAEHPDRVAFGDDAAVAGGLVGRRDGAPVFCGDAIADPLTGLHAARAVLHSLARGGGSVIDVAMAAVAATYAALPEAPVATAVPTPPPPRTVRPLGADNRRVEALITARRGAC
ncbi:CoA transferase [Mycolicibacillus parakoreensis]|uniref:CoA transferase n=1 Tax=Mycolicibacillus parakoreensis TaxID=1069221 RepID=A0ABY3U575_9MYCO|nr:CoA transferase [Mycolicibacillus parakoreensis]MCV7314393.1 CoA transferase [Mycolicibacillus parakoreensis]ULN53261.1 CoA transferase [Mycolicibacillus parakoreensis]HLR99812.1 CoA transferase [Mycolicibacillus parakoreensis]